MLLDLPFKPMKWDQGNIYSRAPCSIHQSWDKTLPSTPSNALWCMKFSSLTLGSRYSSLPVWMLYAVPSHPFGWLFFWPQIVFSYAHTVQVSAEYLRRVLCGPLEFSFCATISPTGLRPVLAPSVFLDSQLCVFNLGNSWAVTWALPPSPMAWELFQDRS